METELTDRIEGSIENRNAIDPSTSIALEFEH